MNEGRVKVKVCGLTEVANAVACAEAGADWIGLNFHPASPRSITLDCGAEIGAALRGQTRAEPVGLFVDRPWVEVEDHVARADLGPLIQIHGNEPPEYLLSLGKSLSPLRAIRAFRLRDAASVDQMVAYLERADSLGCAPYAVLVDTHVPGLAGGTGQSLALDILARLPKLPRLILAGGLTPENVAERVALLRPWMVDVASGVESSPGHKDLQKVKAFVKAVRAVGAATSSLDP